MIGIKETKSEKYNEFASILKQHGFNKDGVMYNKVFLNIMHPREGLREFPVLTLNASFFTMGRCSFYAHVDLAFFYREESRKWYNFLRAFGKKHNLVDVSYHGISKDTIELTLSSDIEDSAELKRNIEILNKLKSETKRFSDGLLKPPKKRGVLKV